MDRLRRSILDNDPTYSRRESSTIYKSLSTMGRWRKYTMDHHSTLLEYAEKFLRSDCRVPLDDKGRTIYYNRPLEIFEYEDEEGISYKGGFWQNGAVVAIIDGDSHKVELYVDNDTAIVHGYPDEDYLLNGVFYGD